MRGTQLALLVTLAAGSVAHGQTLLAPDGLSLTPTPSISSGPMLAPPPVTLPPETVYQSPSGGWSSEPMPMPMQQQSWPTQQEWTSQPTYGPVISETPVPTLTPPMIHSAEPPLMMNSPSMSTWTPVKPKNPAPKVAAPKTVDVSVVPNAPYQRTPSAAKVWRAMGRFR